ncbi:hypothetical protein V491_06802, partial [Pseudogymnoascus sp. VKM F-3775]
MYPALLHTLLYIRTVPRRARECNGNGVGTYHSTIPDRPDRPDRPDQIRQTILKRPKGRVSLDSMLGLLELNCSGSRRNLWQASLVQSHWLRKGRDRIPQLSPTTPLAATAIANRETSTITDIPQLPVAAHHREHLVTLGFGTISNCVWSRHGFALATGDPTAMYSGVQDSAGSGTGTLNPALLNSANSNPSSSLTSDVSPRGTKRSRSPTETFSELHNADEN